MIALRDEDALGHDAHFLAHDPNDNLFSLWFRHVDERDEVVLVNWWGNCVEAPEKEDRPRRWDEAMPDVLLYPITPEQADALVMLAIHLPGEEQWAQHCRKLVGTDEGDTR
jgi:hypothetical protein